MITFAQSLNKVVESSGYLKQAFKAELQFGDTVTVYTRNSVYTIFVVGDGSYLVCGGWFDKKGLAPFKTGIAGCTWGGRIIKNDIVAACGLCLEFCNRVVTSPIKKFAIRKSNKNN